MNSGPLEKISPRIEEVRSRIASSARRVGRDPDLVRLVAVTKTVDLGIVRAAYELGLRHFGENRVEEAEGKIRSAASTMPDAIWHMIGHIQSRKADEVGVLFPWVHSVDRVKVARRIGAAASVSEAIVSILLEVNVSGEVSKQGFDMAAWPDDPAALDVLAEEVNIIDRIGGVSIRGLMTMAPFGENPEMARPIFRKLRMLRDALQSRVPHLDLVELSMGMTADFEVAIEEGATIIRVGTGLFGDTYG